MYWPKTLGLRPRVLGQYMTSGYVFCDTPSVSPVVISHYYWIFENLLIPSQICIFLYILILFNANTIVLINRKVCNELNTTHGYFFNTSFVLISRISQKKIREIKTNDVLKKYPWVVLSSLHMLVPIKKAFVLFF